jgi:hypothetical protein
VWGAGILRENVVIIVSSPAVTGLALQGTRVGAGRVY